MNPSKVVVPHVTLYSLPLRLLGHVQHQVHGEKTEKKTKDRKNYDQYHKINTLNLIKKNEQKMNLMIPTKHKNFTWLLLAKPLDCFKQNMQKTIKMTAKITFAKTPFFFFESQ